MADFAPEVKRYLLDHGCEYKRPAKGDHEWWWSPISNRYFAVDHKIKSRHTANGILKQAGIGKKF